MVARLRWAGAHNDERNRSGPVPLSWGSPVGKRNLRWKGFVEKVGFESGMKEWKSDGWRERRWERWVYKWMRRWIKTRMRLTKWIWKLIPKTRWCIPKWAICDFQGDGLRARKSDNRWGAGTAKRLKRDKIVKIARLSGCKNFVGLSEREKFIFNIQKRNITLTILTKSPQNYGGYSWVATGPCQTFFRKKKTIRAQHLPCK